MSTVKKKTAGNSKKPRGIPTDGYPSARDRINVDSPIRKPLNKKRGLEGK